MMVGFSVNVNEDGKDRIYPLYCHASDWTNGVECENDYKKITLNYSKGSSIQLDFLENKNPKDYAFFEILNKKISFDIELGNVRKNYNFAFYTVQLDKWDDYKDAQSADSRTEIDLMEANRIAYHFTAHKRYDRGGQLIIGTGGTIQQYNPEQRFQCTEPIDRNELYGPGKYIDTTLPIHVEITIQSNNVHIELSQNGKKIYKDDGGEYLLQLNPELSGRKHTFIISLWTAGGSSGDGMWWLDGSLPYYDESYINEVKASIANISISSIV